MEDRTAGNIREELLGMQLHLEDYGVIKTKNGEAPVLLFKEVPEKFYFGNKFFLEDIRIMEADNRIETLKKATIVFYNVTSKNDQDYTEVAYFEPGEPIELP